MIRKEIIETEVRTSGFSAQQQEIIKSKALIDGYDSSIKSLEHDKRRLVAAGKKESDEYKNIDAEVKRLNATRKEEIRNLKQLESQLKLNEMSLAQLEKRAAQYRKEIKNWKPSDGEEALKKMRDNLKSVEEQLEKTRKATGLVAKDMQKTPSALGQVWSKVKSLKIPAGIGAAFAVVRKLVSEGLELAKKLRTDYVQSTADLGDAYGYVSLEAEKLHKKMNITKNDFITGAAATAGLLKNLGLVPKTAAQMASEVQYLSGVMSKWTGGSISAAEASQILTNALLGETKGLRNLGIVVNKNSDEFKARLAVIEQEQGLTKEQAQAMVVLQMSYEQTTDAQNKFAASSDNLLNAGSRLKTWWRGLKESVAEFFALSRTERLDKRRQEVQALNDEYMRQKNVIDPLIDTYEQLYGRANLTGNEQDRLNDAIAQLRRIFPGAITETDNYGVALATDIGLLKEFIRYQDQVNERLRRQVNMQTFDELEKELKEYQKTFNKIERLNKRSRRYQNALSDTPDDFNPDARKLLEDDVRSFIIQSNSLDEINKARLLRIQKGIALMQEEGYSYEFIAKQIGTTVEHVRELGDTYAAAEEERKKAAEKARKATEEAAKHDAFIRQREEAILAAKSEAEREKVEHQKRLKETGLTDELITAIKAKGIDERSDEEKQALDAYEALNKTHRENLQKINDKANAEQARKDKAERERREKEAEAEQERLMKTRQATLDNSEPIRKENADYQQKLKDHGIFQEELSRIEAKALEDRTEEEQRTYEIAEILRKQHEANILKIHTDAIKKWEAEEKERFDRELTALKAEHAEELAAVTTLDDALLLLKDKYQVEDLKKVKTLADARKKIREEQEKEQARAQIKFYQGLLRDLSALSEGDFEGLNLGDMILSEEQKAELEKRINEVRIMIAQLFGIINGGGAESSGGQKEDKKFEYSSISGNVDILGMSPDDWETFFGNLKSAKVGVGEIIAVANALVGLYKTFSDFMTESENKRMEQFRANTQDRRRQIEDEYARGAMSRKTYNSKIQALDRELEDKEAELKLKQAKRNKALALLQAAINIAVAITEALPNIALTTAVGIAGAAQIGLIASKSLTGFEKGGRMKVTRQQDGRSFNAEFNPLKRGYVQGPTVLVGENGTEYVLSAQDLRNPSVAAFINMLEQAKLRGGISDVNFMYQMMQRMPGRVRGGWVDDRPPRPGGQREIPAGGNSIDMLLEESISATRKLSDKLDDPVKAYVTWSGPGGIKEKMDQDSIINGNTTIK